MLGLKSEDFERDYVRPAGGPVLVVGSRVYGAKPDRRKLHAQAIGVDMQPGEGVDRVLDLEDDLPWDMLGGFGHVECMSVLEHSRRPWLLAASVTRALRSGGTIFVTAPFCWRVHAYPSDYWRFTLEGLRELFPGIDWQHLRFTHREVSDSAKVPAVMKDGLPYMARTEACGFGVKR